MLGIQDDPVFITMAPQLNPCAMRRLRPDDDISRVTHLVRSAYQGLANMGLRYTATWQDDEVTLKRVSRGECYVVDHGSQMIATITLSPPAAARGCPWYDRDDVATFHQFGVAPEYQGHGLGSRMLDHVEARARALGAAEIALDTAEPARHLVSYYAKRGYRFIEHAQWDTTNYRSVVMSKSL